MLVVDEPQVDPGQWAVLFVFGLLGADRAQGEGEVRGQRYARDRQVELEQLVPTQRVRGNWRGAAHAQRVRTEKHARIHIYRVEAAHIDTVSAHDFDSQARVHVPHADGAGQTVAGRGGRLPLDVAGHKRSRRRLLFGQLALLHQHHAHQSLTTPQAFGDVLVVDQCHVTQEVQPPAGAFQDVRRLVDFTAGHRRCPGAVAQPPQAQQCLADHVAGLGHGWHFHRDLLPVAFGRRRRANTAGLYPHAEKQQR
ncbi:hypothetical protein T4D_12047 [Trichinella pseudospiralis]|uniref:Uncharacterized protein n=1 Tax=Trichinella pseudospiralis TaxID=6337 RepID=A0A0V1FCU4_TRIPS|nr:hypothetical protein T4D_12047 [Trichinella pseudospiralis]